MTQKEDESLEYCVDIFEYNMQRSKQIKLNLDSLRIILLRGIQDQCVDLLNLMGAWNMSHLYYDDIFLIMQALFKRQWQTWKGPVDIVTRVTKSTRGELLEMELGIY
jgi:hypothetical protein